MQKDIPGSVRTLTVSTLDWSVVFVWVKWLHQPSLQTIGSRQLLSAAETQGHGSVA